MAEVKGKFITLAGMLMGLYEKNQKNADEILFQAVGKRFRELNPEGWYDTKLFNIFMEEYALGSLSGKNAIITLGRNVYPLIKRNGGIPEDIKTPLDLLLFEAKGFELNHRGDDVQQRKFIKQEEGLVVVQAPAPGYNQKLYEGVYLGILEIFGIKTGKVVMTKDAPEFEYEITW